MSYTVTQTSDITNVDILKKTCNDLNYVYEKLGSVSLFDSKVCTGHVLRLPNWRHPVVVEATGKLLFDDYEGVWGNVQDIDRLRCRYAENTVLDQARIENMVVASRVELADEVELLLEKIG